MSKRTGLPYVGHQRTEEQTLELLLQPNQEFENLDESY